MCDSVCADSLLVKLLCRNWFGRGLDRQYGPIDADCCCNQRLLIELPLSSIAGADTVAAVLADAVVAASYRYGLILRVAYHRCCRIDRSFQSASTDQTPQSSHCCCNQGQLIKLLSSIANVVGTTAGAGADCSIVVAAVLSIRNYDESINRRRPMLLISSLLSVPAKQKE